MATAAYATAITQLNQAKIDLARTKVASPVNGYVTNLQLRVGDFAVKGTHDLSLVDTDSFWITGFFEETKLAGIHIGDPAVAALMGFRAPVEGHVESVARGINTPNSNPGALGLASVDAVFTWVRLAQRIPVRIHIDHVPPSGWARHRPDRDGISRQGCQPRLVARFAIALVYAGRRLTCAAHSAMWSASQAVRTLHRRVANRRG